MLIIIKNKSNTEITLATTIVDTAAYEAQTQLPVKSLKQKTSTSMK